VYELLLVVDPSLSEISDPLNLMFVVYVHGNIGRFTSDYYFHRCN
jgi:hypothetical protein